MAKKRNSERGLGLKQYQEERRSLGSKPKEVVNKEEVLQKKFFLSLEKQGGR